MAFFKRSERVNRLWLATLIVAIIVIVAIYMCFTSQPQNVHTVQDSVEHSYQRTPEQSRQWIRTQTDLDKQYESSSQELLMSDKKLLDQIREVESQEKSE